VEANSGELMKKKGDCISEITFDAGFTVHPISPSIFLKKRLWSSSNGPT
jgi:hypothetical protein